MQLKFKKQSPIDSLIIDLILEHYNVQSTTGERERLTGKQFESICKEAERLYYESIMITEEPGVA
tara:strand:- start:164 stop:358 length:195 start_codon:yes stop_codon:yes gene_type:complete